MLDLLVIGLRHDRTTGAVRGRFALAAAVLALLTTGCAETLRLDRAVSLPDPPKQAEPVPATQREHQRILAAYGGDYQDARLEGVIRETLDKLVASSERPDLRYRVTILN